MCAWVHLRVCCTTLRATKRPQNLLEHFLGLGVQPPAPSWGLMIAEGKEFLLFDPWVIAIPGVALSILVLAVNMMGDGVRDISAPENRS